MKKLFLLLSAFFFLGLGSVQAQITMNYFTIGTPTCGFEPIQVMVTIQGLTSEPDIVLFNNQPAFGNYDAASQFYSFIAMGQPNFPLPVEVIEGGVSIYTDWVTVFGPMPMSFFYTATPGDCNPGPYLGSGVAVTGGTPPYLIEYYQNGVLADLNLLLPGWVDVTVVDNNGCVLNNAAFIESTVQGLAQRMLCASTTEATFMGNQYPLGQHIIPAGTSVDGCDSTVLLEVTEDFAQSIYLVAAGCSQVGVQAYIQASTVTNELTYDWQVQQGGSGQIYSETQTNMIGEVGGDYMWLINTGYCTDTLLINDVQPLGIGVSLNLLGLCQDTLTASTFGGNPPFTYAWSSNATQILGDGSSIIMSTNDVFTVTVTDGDGCVGVDSFFRYSQVGLYSQLELFCDGEINNNPISDPFAPYTYAWTGPNGFTSNLASPITYENGTYSLLFTDQNGCQNTRSVERNIPDFSFTHCENTLVAQVANQTVNVIQINQFPNFDLLCLPCNNPIPWPGNGITLQYQIQTNGVGICSDWLETDDIDVNCIAGVKGYVYLDTDTDCAFTAINDFERPASIVQFDNGTEIITALADADGFYYASLDPGTYNITIADTSAYETHCQAYTATVVADELQTLDLGLQGTVACPLIEVEIEAGLIRRCFNSPYYAKVCNKGTVVATNPTATIVLDPLFDFTVSSPNVTSFNGDSLFFELYDLEPYACQNFYILNYLSCDAVLGQVMCAQAYATPDAACLPDEDGIEVEVNGLCDGDSVQFQIINLDGQLDNVELTIIEDQLIFMVVPFNLNPAGEFDVAVPATIGGVYWAGVKTVGADVADVVASTMVLGCGTGDVTNEIVNQFTLNNELDEYPSSAETCDPVIGAFDPNDKAGIPVGYGPQRQVTHNTTIDYKIRFQNTGTDTAFTVVVRDTLPEWLDIATFSPGLSSHYNLVELLDSRIIQWTFPNIMLADSFVNEPASHGFITFKIGIKPTTPLGTELQNSAAIYFDFNEPVITNQTLHTVGANFVIASTNQPDLMPWQVYPNPTVGLLKLVPMTTSSYSSYTATLYNLIGQVVLTQELSVSGGNLDCSDLNIGQYVLTIAAADGTQVAVRQIQIK
jgi:uncharacterized repeat protein (TIGR01451 family)